MLKNFQPRFIRNSSFLCSREFIASTSAALSSNRDITFLLFTEKLKLKFCHQLMYVVVANISVREMAGVE